MRLLRVVVCSLACLVCCTSQHSPRLAESVVLVTLDTTRADALACYGGLERATPNLLQLSRESLRFESARTVAPLTLPAHTSILTGLYPPAHGLRDNALGRLSPRATTLAALAAKRGLATAAFVSALVLDRTFGLDLGFQTYDQPGRSERQSTSHYVERRANETIDAALAWLDARGPQAPVFLWVHLFDAHVPYAPPAEYLALAKGNAYLGEIAFVDAQVGRLMARLRESGRLARTLVIVVADHGESLGEHGEPTHSAFCYDSTIRVPLFVRFPDGYRAGEVERGQASVVDVFPTALDALGIAKPAVVDGVSWFANVAPPDRGVYFESYSGWLNYGWSPLAGWCDARGKYLASSQPEWFDPLRDPREVRERLSEHAGEARDARNEIARVQAEHSLDAEVAPLDAHWIDDLRRLGYAGGGRANAKFPSALEPSDLPSPAARASELERLLVANNFVDERRYLEALEALAPILSENPRHGLARDLAAIACMQLGRFAEAEQHLEARLAIGPERADTHVNLALCRERTNDAERAFADWKRALELDPLEPDAIEGLAKALDQRGQKDEARALRSRLDRRANPPSGERDH